MDDRGARLKQLVATAQQKGYVLFADIDALLPQDYEGGRELDDLLTEIESAGLEVREEPDDSGAGLQRGTRAVEYPRLWGGRPRPLPTPRSAWLCADEGVRRGPGGPPHQPPPSWAPCMEYAVGA